VRLSGRVCANYTWTEAKFVAWQELNRNCESSKCTSLAFVVVVELGSLSSDMLIVRRDVAGMNRPGLISNNRGRHWDVHQVLRDGLAKFEEGNPVSSRALNSLSEKLKSSYWVFIHNVERQRNAELVQDKCQGQSSTIVTISVNNHFHPFTF
jgi:hypothetical protein